MGNEIQRVSLEELCESDRGITYGIVKVGEFFKGGIPVIRGGDIRNGQIRFDDHKRVSQEISNQFSRTILKGGEIVINLISEPGHTAIVPPECKGFNVSRDVAVIPLNDSVNHRFVDYFLKSPQCIQWLTSRLQGSVTQKINLSTLKELPVPIFPISKQASIAHILGTLDDKIELNRQMNATLEAMAQALFKSWFVDFDPVIDNALAADNPIPEPLQTRAATRQARAGEFTPLPPAIQQQFPNRFVFTEEMGWIPEGWEVKEIRERTKTIQYGLTQSASVEECGPKFLRITDIRGGEIKWDQVPFCEVSTDQFEKYKINDGDIFVARTGASTGENIYVTNPVESVFASYLVRLTFEDRAIGRLVGMFMRSSRYFEHINGILGGSAQPNASAQALASASMVFPSEDSAKPFFEKVLLMDKRRAENENEVRTLTKLRDTLLPKLLSGQLRIPNAEQQVAAAE